MEAQLEEMRRLVAELNEASDAYYNGRVELMTDYEWDARFDRLKALEEATGQVLPDSPTHRVSEDQTVGRKEEHEYAALSLAKTKSTTKLADWAEGRPIWVSWKLDGLTLVVTWDEGRLTRVVTRGNGHIGTNITHLAPAIVGIPQRIGIAGHLVVRGEAVISYDDFERFLLESGEDYANPRNLASGSLSLKDVEQVKPRHIRWIPFTLVHTDEDIPSWGERMALLQRAGLDTVEREALPHPDVQSIEAVVGRWTQKVTSKENPYPVDGLVVNYDDTAYASSGSVTGHHASRGGLAFKWQDDAADTELEYVEWSCAARAISPVAVFRPVELEGTTVRRASLCNISECQRLGIGGKGTRLQVIKANKIIPKVVKVTETVGQLEIPAQCPVCGHPTEIVESDISGTQTLHCTSNDCPAKRLKIFVRFVSKEGMNIDGISEQTLYRFINLGWIHEFADIYRLREHAQAMAVLEGFGEKSCANLMRAIERSREVEAHRLLYALTIPLCGIDVCKRLLTAHPLDELMQLATTETDTSFFSHIDGIGPEKSAAFMRWMQEEENMAALHRLLAELHVVQAPTVPEGQRLQGMTFVVTGDVHHYKNRNELKAYIEGQGGRVAGSVSGATSFLINNDVQSTSGKNRKARELGIPVISEDEFMERFG